MTKGCGYPQGDTTPMGGKTGFAKELFARWHLVEAAAQLGSARPRRYNYKGPLIPNGTPIPHPRPSCLPSTLTASYRLPVATSYAAAHVSPGLSTLQQPPLAFPTAPPPPPPPVPLAGIVIGATSGGCLQSPATATTPSRSRTSASPITNNLVRQLKVLADALPVIYNTIVDMVVGTTPAASRTRTPVARACGEGTVNNKEEAEDKDRDKAEAEDKDEGKEDKDEDDDKASSGSVKPHAGHKKRTFLFR
ncbi:uncharacterized protein JCM10292_001314 [Rhodotorula paludigena]|uniref:uncharacterized protein n=1 Tax=Rhodotorula paludigena TaxID=86838 RepID=UPI0031731EAA